MLSAPRASRSAAFLRALAVTVVAAAPLLAAVPASAGGDPLAGRSITGQLVQAYPESRHADGSADTPLSWVRPASGKPVRVDTADLAGVPAGATVRLTMGRAVDDGASGTVGVAHAVTASDVLGTDGPAGTTATGDTDGGTTSDSASATTSAPATAITSATTTPSTRTVAAPAGLTDRVTVVLVEAGGGAPDSTTVADLTSAVDGPVHDFWSSQTGGAVDLGVTSTTDWIPTDAGCTDPMTLWDQAADKADFVPGPGNHLLVYVSSASKDIADCSYGLAEIGSGLGSGGRLYVEDSTTPSLIAHELGHNFGLGHSSGKQCEGTVDTGTCQVQPYQDYYDVMAASWEHVGTLNAAQEARLGVLPAAQRRALAASGPGGSVTLSPLSGRSGVRALELTAPDGTDYWLEYRSATGQDAWLDTTADWFKLQSGVLVHRSGDLPDTSLLLDGTPSPTIRGDADLRVALPVGAPVTLADGFTVTVTEEGGSASVTVATSPAPAAQASAAPPSTSTLPGRGCRSATTCHSGGSAGSTAPAPRAVGSLLPFSIHASAVSAHSGQVRAAGLRLAAVRSPAVLAALTSLLVAGLLLGWHLVRRARALTRRRRGA